MFDFGNTPINEYTKLKANYSCLGEPVLTYNGDWARVTLTGGAALELTSESQLNAMLSGNNTTTVNGASFVSSDIKKIEFGTKVTAIPDSSLNLSLFTSLETINGFHEGLETIGTGVSGRTTAALNGVFSNNTVVLPSTLTALGSSFLYNCDDPNLTIVSNAPASAFLSSTVTLASSVGSSPMYVNGVKVIGKTAPNLIAVYNNLNGSSYYRNLYNGNNLTSFFEALDAGTAQDLFPPGTQISMTISGYPNSMVVGTYRPVKTEEGDKAAVGVCWWYTSNYSASWGSGEYPDTSLFARLNGTGTTDFPAQLPTEVVDHAMAVQVSYLTSAGEAQVGAAGKFHAFSISEVNGSPVGGDAPWEWWVERTGSSTPTNTANPNRTRTGQNATATSQKWGLRDKSGSQCAYIETDGSIDYTYPNTNLRLYPLCYFPAQIHFDVTFNSNGGSSTPATQRVFYNRYATEPSAPTKADQTFIGWFEEGATVAFNFTSTPITKNLTLEAHYE